MRLHPACQRHQMVLLGPGQHERNGDSSSTSAPASHHQPFTMPDHNLAAPVVVLHGARVVKGSVIRGPVIVHVAAVGR